MHRGPCKFSEADWRREFEEDQLEQQLQNQADEERRAMDDLRDLLLIDQILREEREEREREKGGWFSPDDWWR